MVHNRAYYIALYVARGAALFFFQGVRVEIEAPPAVVTTYEPGRLPLKRAAFGYV